MPMHSPIEATRIMKWHRNHLHEIQGLRNQSRNIPHMNKTGVNASHATGQVWVDETV